MAIAMNTNFVNDTDGYLLDAKNVKGGYLIADSLDNLKGLKLSTIVEGSLAYVKNENKFYMYDGAAWQEKVFYDNSTITEKIPSEASSSNKLADKNYVTQFVSEKMSQISSGTAIHSYDTMFALFAQYIYDKVIAENGSSAEVIEALKNAVGMGFQTHTGDEITVSLGDALNNAGLDINNIMSLVNYNYIDEIVKNINGTYLMSIISSWEFNSDINIVEMFENHGITEMEPLSQYFKLKSANIGDNIYFVSPNVPDLWVATKTNMGIMYGSLDSKVDLSNIQNSISDIENNVNGLLNGDIILDKVKTANNAYRDSEDNLITTYYASKSALSQAKSEIAELKETLYGYVLDTTDVEINDIIPSTVTVNSTQYNLVDNVYGLIKEVKGNTIKSENLLVLKDKAETTINGITYSIKDGVIYLNGTSTEFTSFQVAESIFLNGDYVLSYFNNFDTSKANLTLTNELYWTFYPKNRIIHFSTTNIQTDVITINIAGGETFTNAIIKPMLVKGTTAPTEFSKGFNGLKSVTYNGLNISGINLMPLNDFENITNSGVTATLNKNGTISLNGTSTGYPNFKIGHAKLSKGTYYLPNHNNTDLWLYVGTTSGGRDILNLQSITTLQFTLEKDTLVYFSFNLVPNFNTNNFVVYPFLSKSVKTINDFRPYIGQTILTLTATLKGVGSAKDKIVITKNTDNDYYTATKITNIGEVDLGSINFTNVNDSERPRFYTLDITDVRKPSVSSELIKGVAENYEVKTEADAWATKSGLSINTTGMIVAYGTTTPTGSLVYELATPTTEVLSTTLTDNDVMPLLELGGSVEVGESEVKGSSKFEMVYRLSGINPTTTTEVLENE